MGYYTQYSLVAKKGNEEMEFTPEMKSKLAEVMSTQGYEMGDVEELLEGWFDAKWYSHETDMRKFSTFFPDYLFVLSGDGEEKEDSWISYYKNGLCQDAVAKITYEPFNPNLLQ